MPFPWKRILSSTKKRGWVRRSLDRAVVVLAYHDLREPGDFASWMRVEVGQFRGQLEALLTLGSFIGPAQLEHPELLPTGGPYFVLTFDDGHASHLRLGLPVLNELGIHALFFVSTHHLLSEEPFWFDRVVTSLQRTGATTIDLSRVGLREYRFRGREGPRRWADIQELLTDIKALGNPGDPAVELVLRQFAGSLRQGSDSPEELLRPLRVAELRALASSPLCHFGSHGSRHAIFTQLNDETLADSLVSSKHVLEELVGAPVRCVAYPNGDCNDRVVDACRRAGYAFGFVTETAVFRPGCDPYGIPRLLVGGYDSPQALGARVSRLLLAEAVRG